MSILSNIDLKIYAKQLLKSITISFCLGLATTALKAQIKISPYLIGENAWSEYGIFKVKKFIADAKYQTIRIGGNGYEKSGFMDKRAIDLIDYARSVGAEPVLQIPRQYKDDHKALDAIIYLNKKLGKHIKFWSIGNEPDHKNQFSTPEQVYSYFKEISEQIKSYDPEAKIMGFDLSSYKLSYLDRLLGGDLDLTGKIPGKNYYYLDIVCFHNYRFADISKFEADVKDLKVRIAVFNQKRAVSKKLDWAITEFNSHWKVDTALSTDYMPFNFHNGQIFAEMYDLGMREGAFTICPWSILEGGGHRTGTDLSIFDQVNETTYLPRSNYYHTKLLAQNLKSYYLQHSSYSTDLVIIPMGDKTGISVMIMNKSTTNAYPYDLSLRLDNSNIENSIAIDGKRDVVLKDSISSACTQMLLFSNKGKLIKKYTYSAKDAEAKIAPHEKIYRVD